MHKVTVATVVVSVFALHQLLLILLVQVLQDVKPRTHGIALTPSPVDVGDNIASIGDGGVRDAGVSDAGVSDVGVHRRDSAAPRSLPIVDMRRRIVYKPFPFSLGRKVEVETG